MSRAILAVLLTAIPASAQDAKPADPAPLQLTAAQDHKLMMEALGIKSLREGANGMNRDAPNAANYNEAISKGWGFAIIVPNSIQADNGGGLTRGMIGLCNKGQVRKPDDWGALRAWAWGASRALDYFETDQAVDAKQVGIEGLSRYGKGRRWSRWRTISASPSASSAPRARAGQSSTAATSASWSRTSPVPASIIGWLGTSSSTAAP